MKILVTCPPMLGIIDSFRNDFEEKGLSFTAAKVVQTLSEYELKKILPEHDGWIIGDDPATMDVFEAGKRGRLKAAVKWGVGVDNVDFEACKQLGIPVTNTPSMFGAEVADIAMGYVIALARETFQVDAAIRTGLWPKPGGISLSNKTVALIGFGDIGRNAAKRFLAADMNVIAYDPGVSADPAFSKVEFVEWPTRLEEADFIVVTCALTRSSFQMLNADTFRKTKDGVRVVNVGRGPIIDEEELVRNLRSGRVYSAALDVFAIEPLPMDSYLREHPRCILGSHNSSNTIDAVRKTSLIAIQKIADFLKDVG